MSKFNFNRANDDTLNVRMSSEVADKIRQIADEEKVSVQEVCRKFLEVALVEYEREQNHDNKTIPHSTPPDNRFACVS